MSVSIRNRNLWIPNEQTNTCRACLSVCLSSFYICRLDLRCAVEWMFGDKIRDVSIYFFYFNENKSNDEGTRSKTNWSTLKHTNNFFFIIQRPICTSYTIYWLNSNHDDCVFLYAFVYSNICHHSIWVCFEQISFLMLKIEAKKATKKTSNNKNQM